MTAEYPHVLYGALVLVPFVALQVRSYLAARSDLMRIGGRWDRSRGSTLFAVKWFFCSFSFDLFILLAVLAAADLRWGERPVEEERYGLDLGVVLDISRSMLAEDVEPSRLARSVAVVRSVSRQLPSVRMALIGFKGEATTIMPLTDDFTALEFALDGVQPALISAPGTDIEAGLTRGLAAFPPGAAAHRAIVLFSDGEALSGNHAKAAVEAQRQGIPVFAVVAGTTAGAVIPAGSGSLVTDSAGRPVISRADPTALAEIASLTGGALLDLQQPDIAAQIVTRLEAFSDRRQTEGFRLVPVRRYRLFLGLALVSIAVSLLVRVVPWRGMF